MLIYLEQVIRPALRLSVLAGNMFSGIKEVVVGSISVRAGSCTDYLKQNLRRGEGKSLLFGVLKDRLYGKSYCTAFVGTH